MALKNCLISIMASLLLISCSEQQGKQNASAHQSKAIIKTVTGELIDFNRLERKWVIVNYWANWCEPCKKEIPELNAFAEANEDVYLVGVNYDGVDNNRMLELIAYNDIHYYNAESDPSIHLGISDIPGLPVTFIFNRKGQLHKKLFGPQTKQSLEKALS